MHNKLLSLLAYGFMAVLMSACVTTMDKPERKVDMQKALEANVKLGMTYLQQRQRDDALRAFTKAISIDKKSAEAHQGMALVHQVNGEYELAEKSFLKALKGRSDFSYAGIQFAYGRFLMERDRCAEAIPYFEKVSKDFTYLRRANALFSLGRCAEKLGDSDRAIASYEYALNLNERFAPAALELAHRKFDEKDYAKAKQYLDQHGKNSRQSARSLWLGIRLERIFGNEDKEASYALALKNLHPYSQEYLEYKKLKGGQ